MLGTLPSLAVVALSAGALVLAFPARAAFTPSAEGTRVAAATEHSDATRAALETLRRGGNAVDGAVSAALALGVVNPSASGLGGGGFALVYVAREKKVVALDFRETAPASVKADALLARANRQDDQRGAAIGVPGEPAGLAWLSKHYGRVPLARAAEPAVTLATRGFYAGRYLADAVAHSKDRLSVSPELSRGLLPGGAPLSYRAMVTRPELGRTLERFGREGAKPFYEGDIADKIVRAAQAAGGSLEKSDLAEYAPKERAPLTRTIDGRAIYTMPAPSAGGLMLLEVLSLYGAGPTSSLKAGGFGSSATLHLVAEGMRGAIADRARIAGDPDVEPSVAAAYDQALDPKQIAARRARIVPIRTHPAQEFRTREAGTSHLIVADEEGNVVALTTTVNNAFGARVVAGDTGVVLNDELDDFTAPKDLQGFGVVGLGPNRPRAKARPVSSMTPTIVLENGEPILAVGGSGGPRIATGVTQATLARLVFGLDPSACVSAPRVHTTGSPELMVEAEVPEDVRAGLRARGEQVKDGQGPMSAIQMVAWDRKGPALRLFAASDPRKVGFSAAE